MVPSAVFFARSAYSSATWRSCLVAGLIFLATSTHAQTPAPTPPADPLPGLIQQRQQLVQEYEAAAAQRNAFLADKPSKKDLEEVVAALKGIIRKDTEIVRAVQAETLRRTAAVQAENQQVKQEVTVARTDQSSTQQRFYDLQNQITNLELRDKQRQKKLVDLQATADEAVAARSSRDLLAAGLAALSLGLLVYVVKLRGQKPAARRRK